jgi:RES domain-containing protein
MALSGEGARRGAARWNSLGVAVAYTSEHLSLAVCEVFVHAIGPEEADDLMSVTAEFDLREGEIEQQKRWILDRLPRDWRAVGNPATRALGDEWVRSGSSMCLFVPSAVIDGEWNILINPEHPDMREIKIVQTKPFWFDERMFKR